MIRNLIPRASIYTALVVMVIALLTISNAQEHDWFLGEWISYRGFDVYTLENLSDGTYTFTLNTDQYVEIGTWQLSEGQLTQNWNDLTTGEATSATYDLEKLSDTAFNQSGGNLSEGFVFAYTKVTEDVKNVDLAEVPFVEVVPGSYSCFIGSVSPVDAYADETSLVLELRPDTTYAATSSSVSDEGTLSAQPIGQEVFIRYLPLEFFPSASRLELTNSEGQAQAFIFAQDVKGNSYLFQGNEGRGCAVR